MEVGEAEMLEETSRIENTRPENMEAVELEVEACVGVEKREVKGIQPH